MKGSCEHGALYAMLKAVLVLVKISKIEQLTWNSVCII